MNTTIVLIWVFFFVLDFLVHWLLDILNINTILKNRNTIPGMFAGFIDEESYERSVNYSLRKARFGLFSSIQSRMFVVLVLTTGAPGALEALAASWAPTAYWRGLIFLMAAFLALEIAGFPSSLYSRLVIEEEFGFNTAGVRTLLADMIKGLAIGTILLMALLAGLYAARAWIGRYWWAAAWGFMTLFQLVMNVLYPVLIAPVFNKFEPLADGDLKTRLENLARECDFPVRGIFTMDGSRRSRHSNAYFTGIGRFRRIVIFDTFIDTLSSEGMEAVLAHEIGHWKHGHIRRGLILSLALNLGLFALAGVALEWRPLYTAFGLSAPSLHGLIFLVSFFSGPFRALFSPLVNAFSRRQEYQADRFAANRTGGPRAMRCALLEMSRDNLINLTPHPAYSFWHYSHPAPAERLAALEDD